MHAVDGLPLLAFLAPLPPMRPKPPRAGPEWIASVIIGALVFIMVVPMIAIWSFHRPDETVRAQCRAAGGHVVFASVSGDGAPHCRRAGF